MSYTMRYSVTYSDFSKVCENEAALKGRKGAVNNYRKTRAKLNKYVPVESLCITSITEQWIKSFNKWLEDMGHEQQTVAFYNRNIRAVYNKAVQRNLIVNKHPFDNISTQVSVTRCQNKISCDDNFSFDSVSREKIIEMYVSLARKYNNIVNQIRLLAKE